jgi:hypothetical protein
LTASGYIEAGHRYLRGLDLTDNDRAVLREHLVTHGRYACARLKIEVRVSVFRDVPDVARVLRLPEVEPGRGVAA